jgi:DNA primase
LNDNYSKINFDEIRKQCDIVAVVSSYLPLTRKGKNFVGVCPFHDDRNPSMVVSPEKQIYKCFSCTASGNVFTFVRDFEKISFMDAVKKTASICNISIPELDRFSSQPLIPKENAHLYNLLKEAQNYYSFNLKTYEGQVALEYLTKRHITEDVIDKFGIGYSFPDGTKTIKYLQAKGYSIEDMLKVGLATRTVNGIIDTLQGRIIFPIYDQNNQVIAYSGRIMVKKDDEPKYLNTAETPLFHKGDCLYNLYNASNNARKEKCVYVVEGFMDVIGLYRGGIEASVATMGTALTTNHVNRLKRLAVPIHLCLDGDNPGQIATMKSMELFDNAHLEYRIVKPFTKFKDVDEIINNEGKEGLNVALSSLFTPMEFRLHYLKNHYNLSNYEDNKKFVLEAIKYLTSTVNDRLDFEHYVKMISDISNIDVSIIKEYIATNYKKQPISKPTSNRPFPNAFSQKKMLRAEKAQRLFVRKMLSEPLALTEYQLIKVHLYDEVCDQIAAYILDYFKKNGSIPLEADLYSRIEEGTLQSELAKIGELDNEPIPIEELIKIINSEFEEYRKEETVKRIINESSDPLQQASELQKLIDARKNRQ